MKAPDVQLKLVKVAFLRVVDLNDQPILLVDDVADTFQLVWYQFVPNYQSSSW